MRSAVLIFLSVALTWFLIDKLPAKESPVLKQVVAVKDVCAWPNLTLLPDGTIVVIFHNQPNARRPRKPDSTLCSSAPGNWIPHSRPPVVRPSLRFY